MTKEQTRLSVMVTENKQYAPSLTIQGHKLLKLNLRMAIMKYRQILTNLWTSNYVLFWSKIATFLVFKCCPSMIKYLWFSSNTKLSVICTLITYFCLPFIFITINKWTRQHYKAMQSIENCTHIKRCSDYSTASSWANLILSIISHWWFNIVNYDVAVIFHVLWCSALSSEVTYW